MIPVQESAALTLLTWLSASDPLPADADAVIGFGHFDLRIPAVCGTLFRGKRASHLVFTGGIGAGTGTLGGPEADAFRAELRRDFPEIADDSVFLETRSTNTAENIRFTERELAGDPRGLALGKSIRSVILVAHPLRLRRVRQTWRLLQADVPAAAFAPPTSMDQERRLYHRQNLSFEKQLVGEIDRLRDYPARGWIERVTLPAEVLAAREYLAGALL